MNSHFIKSLSVKALVIVLAISAMESVADVEFKMLPSATAYQKVLFDPTNKNPSCKIVTRGIGNSGLVEVPEVAAITDAVLALFANPNGEKLKSLFHPRLKMNKYKSAGLLSEISDNYGTKEKTDANLYRVFALNTIDGTPHDIECPEDKLSLGTHYGFPIQFGAWFQITGKTELARLYISIVPTESAWRIAAWHLQQWTHVSKDAEQWVAEALADSSRQNKNSAYAKLDMAYKLLDGGKFFYPQLRKDIMATRDSMLAADDSWLKAVQVTAPKDGIVYAGTFLAKSGVGILARIAIEKDLNLKDKEKFCSELSNKIFLAPWTDALAGLHCDFTFLNAPPEKRGTIGGVTINRAPKKSP